MLIRELARGRAAELVAGLDEGRAASVRGRLYAIESTADGGWYPILLRDPASATDDGNVRGVVHDARGVDWAAMDQFEDAHDGPGAEYARREIPVTLADGSATTAFAYCYARRLPSQAQEIRGGDFAAWLWETGRSQIAARE